MTRRIGKTVIIEPEVGGVCEICGAREELRPYGPNGENVCFDCGMRDEGAAREQFAGRILDAALSDEAN